MKNSDFKTGSPNHGHAKKKSMRGTTIVTPYGKDSSDVNGSKSDERTGKCGGGSSDLSHSLTGAGAVQRHGGGG